MTGEIRTPDISHRVVEKVAASTGADPLNLDPLYNRVDPDCLNALFQDGVSEGYVEFRMAGYTVTIQADGTVEVAQSEGEEREDRSLGFQECDRSSRFARIETNRRGIHESTLVEGGELK